MIMLRSCLRCTGDLYLDRDQYGQYLTCLKCGYYPDDSEVAYLLSPDTLQGTQEADGVAKPALAA